jgi:hypothetical protein
VLLALIIADRLVKNGSRPQWLAFALCLVLGFYTMPIMLYAAGIIVLWLFIRILLENTWQRRRQVIRLASWVMVSAVLTAALYTPLLLNARSQTTEERGTHLVGDNSLVSPTPASWFIEESVRYPFTLYGVLTGGFPTVIRYSLWLFVLIALVRFGKASNAHFPVELAVILWIVPLYAVMRIVPSFRTFIFLAPLLYISASGGLSVLLKFRWNALRSVLLLTLTGLLALGVHLYQRSIIEVSRDLDIHRATDVLISDVGRTEVMLVPSEQALRAQCDGFRTSIFLYELDLRDVRYQHAVDGALQPAVDAVGKSCLIVICDVTCTDAADTFQANTTLTTYEALGLSVIDTRTRDRDH